MNIFFILLLTSSLLTSCGGGHVASMDNNTAQLAQSSNALTDHSKSIDESLEKMADAIDSALERTLTLIEKITDGTQAFANIAESVKNDLHSIALSLEDFKKLTPYAKNGSDAIVRMEEKLSKAINRLNSFGINPGETQNKEDTPPVDKKPLLPNDNEEVVPPNSFNQLPDT